MSHLVHARRLRPARFTKPALVLLSSLACESASTNPTPLTSDSDEPSASTDQSAEDAGTVPIPTASCEADDGEGSDLPCVADLEITQIDLNQGVGAILFEDGEWVPGNGVPGDSDTDDERNVPVVQGRDGLMVAAWSTPAGWEAREVTARLVLSGAVDKVYLDTKSVSGDSSAMSDRDGTFNWEVDGEDLVTGVEMTVDLREADSSADGSDSVNRFPTEPESLRIPDNPMTFEVTVVPITNTDPSCSRTAPATDEPYLERYTNILRQWNPAGDLKVHAYQGPPIEVNAPEECFFGTTEDTGVLYKAYMARLDAEVHANHVYYAVIDVCAGGMPGSECSGAGGMAWNWGFVAAGVWWGPDDDWYGFNYVTEVHEVGHAQGRGHAPAGGAPEPDPDYPVPDGTIETWGYGIVDGRIVDGYSQNYDYMAYVYDLAWSSAYTWQENARYIAAYQNWDRAPLPGVEFSTDFGLGDAKRRTALRNSDTMLIKMTRPDGTVSYKAIHGGFEPELANSQETIRFHTADARTVDVPVWRTTLDGGIDYVVTRMPAELQDIRRIEDHTDSTRGPKVVSPRDVTRYLGR